MKERNNLELNVLLLKSTLIDKLTDDDGVYLLYGNLIEQAYIEAFSPFNVSQAKTIQLVTDLDRLSEYGEAFYNKWRWKRNNN